MHAQGIQLLFDNKYIKRYLHRYLTDIAQVTFMHVVIHAKCVTL